MHWEICPCLCNNLVTYISARTRKAEPPALGAAAARELFYSCLSIALHVHQLLRSDTRPVFGNFVKFKTIFPFDTRRRSQGAADDTCGEFKNFLNSKKLLYLLPISVAPWRAFTVNYLSIIIKLIFSFYFNGRG